MAAGLMDETVQEVSCLGLCSPPICPIPSITGCNVLTMHPGQERGSPGPASTKPWSEAQDEGESDGPWMYLQTEEQRKPITAGTAAGITGTHTQKKETRDICQIEEKYTVIQSAYSWCLLFSYLNELVMK